MFGYFCSKTLGCQPPFNQRLNPWIQPLVSDWDQRPSSLENYNSFWTQSRGALASDSIFPHLCLFGVYFFSVPIAVNFPGYNQPLLCFTPFRAYFFSQETNQSHDKCTSWPANKVNQKKDLQTPWLVSNGKNGELLNHLEVVAPIISTPSITFYDSA